MVVGMPQPGRLSAWLKLGRWSIAVVAMPSQRLRIPPRTETCGLAGALLNSAVDTTGDVFVNAEVTSAGVSLSSEDSVGTSLASSVSSAARTDFRYWWPWSMLSGTSSCSASRAWSE